jgi:hypothetical protein
MEQSEVQVLRHLVHYLGHHGQLLLASLGQILWLRKMRGVCHLIGVTQGRRDDGILVVMDQDDPLLAAHGHFPYGGHACPLHDFP